MPEPLRRASTAGAGGRHLQGPVRSDTTGRRGPGMPKGMPKGDAMSVSSEELEGARARVAERFGTAKAPAVMYRLPADVVRDTALNIARAWDGDATAMPRGERLLVALGVVSQLGGGGQTGLGAWLAEAAQKAGRSAADVDATLAVALTCATYNGYYKFRALVEGQGKAFESFQPALRATPFVKSPLPKALVELICIAISVQNGCSHCVTGHIQSARQAGATDAAIDEAVRSGAVAGALAAWELQVAQP